MATQKPTNKAAPKAPRKVATKTVSLKEAVNLPKHYVEGMHDFKGGLSLGQNPHTPGTGAHDDWSKGWHNASQQAE